MVTINPFAIYDNMKAAKEAHECAQFAVDMTDGMLFNAKEDARQALRKLGKLKVKCFGETVPNLVKLLEEIKYTAGEEIVFDNKKIPLPPLKLNQELQGQCSVAVDIAKSSVTGVAGGAVAAFALYQGVGALGAASTGTAISTLSGAAARNAILAWLGGGPLAAAGAGIQGGLIVLGWVGLAAGALITVVQLGSKSEAARAEAEAKMYEAFAYEDAQNQVIEKLRYMKKIADLARELLKRINDLALAVIPILKENIEKYGREFDKLPENVQFAFFRALVFIDLLNAFAKIKIVDDDGTLYEKNEDEYRTIENNLNL